MENAYFFKKMRTGSLICLLLVRKCLCASISRGKPSIYFLINIEYVVYVVYVVYVIYVVVYVGLTSMTFSWAGDLGWPLSGHITKGQPPYIYIYIYICM